MKYYGDKSVVSVMRIILNIMLIIGVCMFVYISWGVIKSQNTSISYVKKIILFILFATGSTSLIKIIYYLKRILDSLVKVEPFIEENVNSLYSIALQCFIITACYLINFMVNPKYVEFNLVTIDMKGIHTDMEFFIFFFAGMFILILSKVFKQAVDVKKENDLTI